MSKNNTEHPRKVGVWHFIKTSMAAAIGIQSNKNRELDFSQSSIVPYIITGVVFTALFVLALVFIVSLVV